jgi:hypothetical protein
VSWRRPRYFSRSQTASSFPQDAHSAKPRRIGDGWYRLLLLGLASICLSCERTDNSIIDVNGLAPLLTNVVVSPSSVNTDSINVGPSREPEDTLHLKIAIFAQVPALQGSHQIAAVEFSVLPQGSTTPLVVGQLADDGSPPDESGGDGTYSGWAAFDIQRVEIGTFQIEVTVVGQNGFRSNTLISPLQIIRGNRPPGLSNLEAPDTVKLASQDQLLLLQVTASDPDGLADVQRVVFNSYRPNGAPSSGNPFPMFDDGNASHGDAVRGDGIYSLTILLPSTSQTGTYRFEFQAFDRSNDSSSVILHSITVTQ